MTSKEAVFKCLSSITAPTHPVLLTTPQAHVCIFLSKAFRQINYNKVYHDIFLLLSSGPKVADDLYGTTHGDSVSPFLCFSASPFPRPPLPSGPPGWPPRSSGWPASPSGWPPDPHADLKGPLASFHPLRLASQTWLASIPSGWPPRASGWPPRPSGWPPDPPYGPQDPLTGPLESRAFDWPGDPLASYLRPLAGLSECQYLKLVSQAPWLVS